MAEIQWWYAREEEQLGPVSPAELRRLAGSGGLAATDLVWREGMAEWAPAARIKGLFPESRDPADDAAPHGATPRAGAPPVAGNALAGSPLAGNAIAGSAVTDPAGPHGGEFPFPADSSGSEGLAEI